MKNFLKKFLKYLSIVIILSAGLIFFTQKTDFSVKKYVQDIFPCSSPLKFSVGNVDEKFGLSKEEITILSRQAAEIWNKSAGKNVLVYDPEASFKINLIFDSRQAATIDAEKLEEDLSTLKLSQEKIEDQYTFSYSVYNKKVKQYEEDLDDYEKELKEYNKEVAYWNKRGGAPEDEYEELQDKKNKLKDMYGDLEDLRKEINQLAGQTNNLASEEKSIVNEYNSNVVTYKNKYGGAREFEKGVFSGQEINIYQFKEQEDLRLTLTHELGHYLGFGHTENSQSIMYYMIGDQDMENLTLTQEDLAELNRVCKIK